MKPIKLEFLSKVLFQGGPDCCYRTLINCLCGEQIEIVDVGQAEPDIKCRCGIRYICKRNQKNSDIATDVKIFIPHKIIIR